MPGCGRCKCGWRGCRCHCSKCYKKTQDLVCIAKNEACKRLKQPFLKALDGARNTFRLAEAGWNKATKASRAAGRYLKTAKHEFTNAQNSLAAVKRGFGVSLQLSKNIASFGSNGLIHIRKITFHSSLSSAAGGKFSLSITAAILGKTQTVSLNANIRDVRGTIARPLGEKIVKGFGKLPLVG